MVFGKSDFLKLASLAPSCAHLFARRRILTYIFDREGGDGVKRGKEGNNTYRSSPGRLSNSIRNDKPQCFKNNIDDN